MLGKNKKPIPALLPVGSLQTIAKREWRSELLGTGFSAEQSLPNFPGEGKKRRQNQQ
jgi:hypothetical protein